MVSHDGRKCSDTVYVKFVFFLATFNASSNGGLSSYGEYLIDRKKFMFSFILLIVGGIEKW
jgi:hypothetical protein